MLKMTSRFVLEVLPYLISALVAAVLVPGFLYSLTAPSLPGVLYSEVRTEAIVTPNGVGHGENTLELIRQDHGAFATSQKLVGKLSQTAATNLVNH